jgi:uncharacterized SAM-binding protein YcdF (DUF218 family)
MLDDLSTRTALKAFVLPPGVFVWLLLLSVMTWRQLLGRFLAVGTAAAIYLLSTPFVAAWMAAGLEIHAPVSPAKLQAVGVDALVVLLAGRYTEAPEYGRQDTVSRYSRDRLSYAAHLHRKTGLPIILSGGLAKDEQPALAILGDEVLQSSYGIRAAAVETQSRNTWENARNLLPILAAHDIDKMALITHAWHMRRALLSFRDSGLDILPAPTYFIRTTNDDVTLVSDWLPSVNSLHDSTNMLHEYLGLLWYRYFQPVNV